MSKTRFVDTAGLPGFLGFLQGLGMEILAPCEKPSASKPATVVFAPWRKGDSICLAKASVPPKKSVLPECETLFTFRTNPAEVGQQALELAAGEDAAERVVFGCRCCDARGFDCLDKPYMKGLFVDPYYQARREKLTVISLTCPSGCETCFCHWVGGGPSSPTGSDILMTEIEGGYSLQAVSKKGEALLDRTSLADGEEAFHKAKEARKKAWATLKPAPKLEEAPEKLKAMFGDVDFWREWTSKCLSCGACTYFCPTCYCFNITDEGEPASPQGGRRLRSWDNCMTARYTREASGHNPRPEKLERMRNRVSHKFWTFPENWGSFLCSGCGRCISACPVHLDIRAIVLAAMNAAGKDAGRADG